MTRPNTVGRLFLQRLGREFREEGLHHLSHRETRSRPSDTPRASPSVEVEGDRRGIHRVG